MTIKELEELARGKARRLLRIETVTISHDKSEKCPDDMRHGVHIGLDKNARHFYAASKKEALEEAVEWINKHKAKQ